jgi:hypothetical protein
MLMEARATEPMLFNGMKAALAQLEEERLKIKDER